VLELAAHSVAHDRAADLATDHESSACNGLGSLARLKTRFGQREMHDEPRPSRAATRPHRGGEV